MLVCGGERHIDKFSFYVDVYDEVSVLTVKAVEKFTGQFLSLEVPLGDVLEEMQSMVATEAPEVVMSVPSKRQIASFLFNEVALSGGKSTKLRLVFESYWKQRRLANER